MILDNLAEAAVKKQCSPLCYLFSPGGELSRGCQRFQKESAAFNATRFSKGGYQLLLALNVAVIRRFGIESTMGALGALNI